MHSHHERPLSDTAGGGQELVIHLRVHRFLCRNNACTKRTFAEQIPGLTVRYGQRSPQASGGVAVDRAGHGWPCGCQARGTAGGLGEPDDADQADPPVTRTTHREGPTRVGGGPIRGCQKPVRDVGQRDLKSCFRMSACRYPGSRNNVGDVGIIAGHGGAARRARWAADLDGGG